MQSRGFTLVETIIALLILAIGLLAMAAVPVMTTRLMTLLSERETAVLYATQALEMLEASRDLPTSSIFSGDLTGAISSDRYRITWSKAADPSNTYSSILTVVVSWDAATGPKSVTQSRTLAPF